jgi:hypothetical protein
MVLRRIDYQSLTAKQKEIYNFQKVAALLADYGFNCIKLSDDWQGADFLAYHKDGNQTLKVQLKGRAAIDKKYIGKNLHVVFPLNGLWYLIEHDVLVQVVAEKCNWLNTGSWIENGCYHSASPGKALLEALAEYKIA